MIWYFLRRLLYMLPILVGINVITFALFFILNTPDDIARMHLGEKYVSPIVIQQWKQQHGYDLPLFYNTDQKSILRWTETLFFKKAVLLFCFQFGLSDAGRDIGRDIIIRAWPSLAIALPTLLIGLFLNVSIAMGMAYFKETYFDTTSVMICIALMSISSLFYIITGQYVFAKLFKWFPISGYVDGLLSWKFVSLPIIVAVCASMGSSSRWYRALFLEQTLQDYVKTAQAKGLSSIQVFFKHILKNALLPILTGVVVLLPTLFMGSLILESFFGIPGLGSYTIDAISNQDFAIVKAMVFLGSVLHIIGLMLTDFVYVMVDPRVRFS